MVSFALVQGEWYSRDADVYRATAERYLSAAIGLWDELGTADDDQARDRLLEQESGVFPRRLARVQRRPRSNAARRDRRDTLCLARSANSSKGFRSDGKRDTPPKS